MPMKRPSRASRYLELPSAPLGANIVSDGTIQEPELQSSRLLKIGIVGSIVTAICCFTPALVVLLGAVGLSALVGFLDYVLLPILVLFILTTGYALWKRRQQN